MGVASWGVRESDQEVDGATDRRGDDDQCCLARRPPHFRKTTHGNRKGRGRGGRKARLTAVITLSRRVKLQPRPPTVNQPLRFDPPIGSPDIFTAGENVEAGNKVAANL